MNELYDWYSSCMLVLGLSGDLEELATSVSCCIGSVSGGVEFVIGVEFMVGVGNVDIFGWWTCVGVEFVVVAIVYQSRPTTTTLSCTLFIPHSINIIVSILTTSITLRITLKKKA